MIHNFKELKVWQKARILVKKIYDITRKFPDEEKFVLVSQMRRAAISITSNIAEGSGKSSNKDFCRFLEISSSSTYELESQCILSFDIGYIFNNELDLISNDLMEIQKMLYGLKSSLQD